MTPMNVLLTFCCGVMALIAWLLIVLIPATLMIEAKAPVMLLLATCGLSGLVSVDMVKWIWNLRKGVEDDKTGSGDEDG